MVVGTLLLTFKLLLPQIESSGVIDDLRYQNITADKFVSLMKEDLMDGYKLFLVIERKCRLIESGVKEDGDKQLLQTCEDLKIFREVLRKIQHPAILRMKKFLKRRW